MKSKRLYLIASITILSIVLIGFGITYAWFLPKANSSVIKSGDISLNITGYVNQTEGDDNTICQNYPKALKNDTIDLNLNFFDNTLTFGFVIENTSKADANVEIKLSDFSKYIFESYGNEITTALKKKAALYNSKFFLYFDRAKLVDGSDISINDGKITFNDSVGEKIELLSPYFVCDDKTLFLWKYSNNNPFINFNVNIGETKTIYISLKNSQSSTSIKVDYLNWLYSYGINYIKDIKNITDEEAIKIYLKRYYDEEVSTLLSDGDQVVLPDTIFNLDYFEFVASTKKIKIQ